MSTFKVEIEDLIGSVGDDTLISDALQAIGSEIIDALPPVKLSPVSKTAAISSSGTAIGAYKVLAVDLGDYRAKEVPAVEKARYTSSASMYQASVTSPVYYIEDETIFVVNGSSTVNATMHYVPKIPTSDGSTAIVHGASTTANFPDEARRALITGTALRCLQRLLSDKIADEDSELVQTITVQISSIKDAYERELFLLTGRGGIER